MTLCDTSCLPFWFSTTCVKSLHVEFSLVWYLFPDWTLADVKIITRNGLRKQTLKMVFGDSIGHAIRFEGRAEFHANGNWDTGSKALTSSLFKWPPAMDGYGVITKKKLKKWVTWGTPVVFLVTIGGWDSLTAPWGHEMLLERIWQTQVLKLSGQVMVRGKQDFRGNHRRSSYSL